MKTSSNKTVLISGASIAGLTCAYFMYHLGYQVTVVEQADALRAHGSAVNLAGKALDAAKQMGIYQKLKANALQLEKWEFKNADNVTVGELPINQDNREEEIEIERDKLLQILMGAVQSKATFVFADRITGLSETTEGIEVNFKNRPSQLFQLVLGCDGAHSGVRKLWFGPEAEYIRFLNHYFSLTIVPKLLIPQGTAQMYNVPGKVVMLNAYNNKTDVCFCFYSEQQLNYDYRNTEEQSYIIDQKFAAEGWRTTELLGEMQEAGTAYFDQFCQVKIAHWAKGRVALVGDAAHCASPAAGIGGSLAMAGAAALTDALTKHPNDYAIAFREYEQSLRPFVEDVQATAVNMLNHYLIPPTEEAIRERNTMQMFG